MALALALAFYNLYVTHRHVNRKSDIFIFLCSEVSLVMYCTKKNLMNGPDITMHPIIIHRFVVCLLRGFFLIPSSRSSCLFTFITVSLLYGPWLFTLRPNLLEGLLFIESRFF